MTPARAIFSTICSEMSSFPSKRAKIPAEKLSDQMIIKALT
jgi:hypothetical protein